MKNSLISVLIGTGLNLAQAEFLAVNIPIFNKKIRYLFSYPLPKKAFLNNLTGPFYNFDQTLLVFHVAPCKM